MWTTQERCPHGPQVHQQQQKRSIDVLPKPDNLTCCLHIAKSLRRSKKTPDRLFDQLLGLSGHGGRDDEPERLDRVASENSVLGSRLPANQNNCNCFPIRPFPGDCLKSRRQLEAEFLVLRHQQNVLRQRATKSTVLELGRSHSIVVFLASLMPAPSSGPETIVRWHRMGFAAYWRWKSRPLGGRSQIDKEVRDLIRRVSFAALECAPHPL
jgi:hypothetical protein